MSRLQYMMRLSQDDICSFDEILVNLVDYGKELHRATVDLVALLISKICLFKEVKNYVVDFLGYILYNLLIIVLIVYSITRRR